MQSVPITTKVVSLNPAQARCPQYKSVGDLRQVSGYIPDHLVSSTNKTDRHDIAEILLKVALSIITVTEERT